jgi:transcriptional regulator with PAS, ATPase and Fis domain
VRIIVSTNRDLGELAKSGTFRQDLFYRINVMRLVLPPLHDRKEDIPLLVEHFINKLNLLYEKQVSGLSPEALALLMSHDFPGNIRELENVIEHAFVLCNKGQIEPHCLPDTVIGPKPHPVTHGAMDIAVKAMESRMILDALKRNNYNRLAAACDLGMHKSTLFRKIKTLGIRVPKIDGRHRREKKR